MSDTSTSGKNGVVITRKKGGAANYRTYEIYQRQRVGESTEKIRPTLLVSDDFRRDPYPALATLREHYPCYRNWMGNSYWITRYDDVTSILADTANYETRSRAFLYGMNNTGVDLNSTSAFLSASERLTDHWAPDTAARVIKLFANDSEADLATRFAARFASELLCDTWGVPAPQRAEFVRLTWAMQRGASWHTGRQEAGRRAFDELVTMLAPVLDARRQEPADDLLTTVAQIDDRESTALDITTTLLKTDLATLHGSLANLWYLLLTHPAEFEKARSNPRMMKLAYLEGLRHSTPVISAVRYARHEVERFGQLLPEGAQLVCAAAAANRDPRVFDNPDTFIVDRPDLTQREPRGQYRADGLASGIAPGLGLPSRQPAIPEDRARSRYALNRDTAVTASMTLLDMLDNVAIAADSSPAMVSLSVGEMHTCWRLPVTFSLR